MNKKYTFGKLGNKMKYLYLEDTTISIKSGNLALFGDNFLIQDESISIKEICNIEITRPMIKSGSMKIITSSGKIVELEIATIKQYNKANEIKKIILK